MIEKYKVLNIYEDDFGCEERTDDHKTQVIVALKRSDGKEITIKQEDDWLYQQDINEGDEVDLMEEILQKRITNLSDKELNERFEFRNILSEEADQAASIEEICFPPNEACSEAMMKERAVMVSDLFLVAVDKKTGKIAGFLNGIATDEHRFRDEFFSNAKLHDPAGKNVMLLGLDVLPQYRGQGLAKEIMFQYLRREKAKGRQSVTLTCLKSKVKMYEKMGFSDLGISGSTWGGEEWHEMRQTVNI